MANDATMTVKAVFLPDEIQKILENQTYAYNPGTGNNKWWYGLVNVLATSQDLIIVGGGPLGNSAAGGGSIDAGGTLDTVAASDEVKFLFVKNLGVTHDGSTSTTDSVYINFDHDGDAAVNTGISSSIEIAAVEVWFGKINATEDDIHCIAGAAGFGGSGGGKVQCLVAAVIKTDT